MITVVMEVADSPFFTYNMKQRSTDGCGPRDGAAGGKVRATLERGTRFRDDWNTVVAMQRRARRGYGQHAVPNRDRPGQ